MGMTAHQMLPLVLLSLGTFAGLGFGLWVAFAPRLGERFGKPVKDTAPTPTVLDAPPASRALCLGAAVTLAVLLYLATTIPAMGALGAWLGWSLPAKVAAMRRRLLLRGVDQRLVELVRDLNEGLSAGMNLLEAVEYAERRAQPPLKVAVTRLYMGLSMGQRLESAFADLAAIVQTDTARKLAEAMTVGLRFGGSIPAVMQRLEIQATDRQQGAELRESKVAGPRKQATAISVAVPIMGIVYLTSLGPDVKQFYLGISGTFVLIGVMGMIAFARKWMRTIGGNDTEERTHGN